MKKILEIYDQQVSLVIIIFKKYWLSFQNQKAKQGGF